MPLSWPDYAGCSVAAAVKWPLQMLILEGIGVTYLNEI